MSGELDEVKRKIEQTRRATALKQAAELDGWYRDSRVRKAHRSSAMPGKQCIYFPVGILKEIRTEARRQGRPFAWVVREAVRIALPKLKAFGMVTEDAPEAPSRPEFKPEF